MEWNLKQGQRTVSDFAIEFRIRAAASGWDAAALKSVFFSRLKRIYKGLAILDEAQTLGQLISLSI